MKKKNTCIDFHKIHCIHLPDAHERKKKVDIELNRYFPDSQIVWIDGIRNTNNPARGCGESFCTAIQQNIHEKYVILCEDDFEFLDGGMEKLQNALKCIPADADLLLGGSYNLKHTPEQMHLVNDHWLRVGDYASHHFIILFQSSYARVLSYLSQTEFSHLDRYIGNVFSRTNEMNVYVAWPMPIRQVDSYSSIAKQETQYNTLEWSRTHRLLWYNPDIHKHASAHPPPVEENTTCHASFSESMTLLRLCVEFAQKYKLLSMSEWSLSISPWNTYYWFVQPDIYSFFCMKFFCISIIELNKLTSKLQDFYSVHEPTKKISQSMICQAYFLPSLFDRYTTHSYQKAFSSHSLEHLQNTNRRM